eukprot:gene9331-12573_t
MLTVIKDTNRARFACETINKNKIIALDLEGKNLGREGTIGLIQIGLPDEVFVFDMECGLKEILESETIHKIMFDCRNDADILFHNFGIQIRTVLDLQLGEVMIRILQNDLDYEIDLLSKYFNRKEIENNFEKYQGMHKLSSLGSLLERLDLGDADLKEDVTQAFREDENFWLNRPISGKAIDYAAQDVISLFRIYDYIMNNVDDEKSFVKELLDASDRYIESRCSMVYPSDKQKKYFFHGILPLGIIDDGFMIQQHTNQRNIRKCACCLRDFLASSLSISTRRCNVCRAIDVKSKAKENYLNRINNARYHN